MLRYFEHKSACIRHAARTMQMMTIEHDPENGFYAVESHDDVAELAHRFMLKHSDAFVCAGSRGDIPVLVTTCPKDESDPSGIEAIGVPDWYIVEPICDELWNPGKANKPSRKRSNTAAGPRASSTHPSPTKFVWATCDALQVSLGREPTSAEVREACEPEGVHKSTASTQFYKWRRAQK